MRIDNLLEYLSQQILSIKGDRPILVAIDGVDTSGKTTLSNNLVNFLETKNYTVIQSSIDGFHNPKEVRYRLGSKSPEGYYRDSFNYNALIQNLLKPLRENSKLEYKTAVYDFKTETNVKQNYKLADKNSILIMEGVFLLRSELIQYWDYKIFLHVNFDEVIKRAKKRDQYLFGSEIEIENRYRNKYIPGQQIYLEESQPHKNANIIINNNDVYNPIFTELKEEINEMIKRALEFGRR